MKCRAITVQAVCAILMVGLTVTWHVPLLRAQATATANQGITGSVTDATGAAVPAARVVARNASTGVEFSTDTGAGGYFSFPGLVVATYSVTVSKTGFQTSVRENVTILAGLTPNIDFQLK